MLVRNTLIVSMLSLFLLLGCSGNKETAKSDTDTSISADLSGKNILAQIPKDGTLKDTLEFLINEAMTKLHYGDKSGLYENELRYYTDEHSFDDYLRSSDVRAAQADSLTHVDVLSAMKFPSDSLYAEVRVHFLGKKGTESFITDTVPMFFSEGRWKRPLVSHYINQVQYEKLIQQAEHDAGK